MQLLGGVKLWAVRPPPPTAQTEGEGESLSGTVCPIV